MKLKEPNALWTWVNQDYKKTAQNFFVIFKEDVQPRWGKLSLASKARCPPALAHTNMFPPKGLRAETATKLS